MSSRDEFEAWAEKNGHDIYRSGIDGDYYFQSTQWSWDIWQAATSALEAKCAALAAETSEINGRLEKLFQIINNADNDYCMCGEAMKTHVHGGCGHPTGMFDYHYSQWLESGIKTPATDAFLAEVRASTSDEICLKIRNAITNCYQDEQVGLDAAATICGEFAAQLRKGASA